MCDHNSDDLHRYATVLPIFFFHICTLWICMEQIYSLTSFIKYPFRGTIHLEKGYVQTSTNLSAYNREQKFVRPAHFVNITIHNLQLRLSLFQYPNVYFRLLNVNIWNRKMRVVEPTSCNEFQWLNCIFFGVFLLILKGGKLCQYVITKISVYHL